MDDLNPITRTERLLDGEDLTPTNREEMFIKRIYDKTQEIPEPVNRKEYFLKKAGEAGGDITVESLSVTQNGTYTAPSGKAYTPVTVEVAPPENSYQLKSITTPTSLATFEASAMPMPSLKVSVEAKQDLHGYDHPWPGGAGKNKLPLVLSTIKSANTSGTWSGNMYTYNGITFTVTTDTDGNVTGISISGTASSEAVLNLTPEEYHTLDYYGIATSGEFKLSGCPSGGSTAKYALQMRSGNSVNIVDTGAGVLFTANATSTYYFRVIIANGQSGAGLNFYPMICLSTVADSTFAPYSNECPISGWDNAIVTDTDDVDNPTVTQTTTISLGQTVYGGEVDVVNGGGKITHGYIASYNGETLPSTWISSMDAYAEGTTPTTGAEVCYELATPTTVSLTPTLIKSLNGTNNLSVDCGEIIEGEYFKALGGE